MPAAETWQVAEYDQRPAGSLSSLAGFVPPHLPPAGWSHMWIVRLTASKRGDGTADTTRRVVDGRLELSGVGKIAHKRAPRWVTLVDGRSQGQAAC